jgi:hypothetical protein
MNDLYFIRLSGQIRGPFNWSQLVDLRNRGRLQGFHEISADRVNWVEAGTLAELFPPRAPPQMPGPAAPGGALPGAGDQWYYADAMGQRQGPVDRQQLAALAQNGTVREDTLAWCKGMADWQPLGQAAPDIFAAPPPETPLHFGPGAVGQTTFDWKTPRTGVLMALIGTFVFAGGLMFMALAMMFSIAGAGAGEGSLFAAGGFLALLAMILMGAATILETIGFGFCAGAPHRSGARGLGIATFILALAGIVLSIIGVIVLFTTTGIAMEGDRGSLRGVFLGMGTLLIIGLIVALLFVAYRFIFLLFLRAVSVACQAMGLAQQLIYVMIAYGVLVLISFGLELFTSVAGQGNAPAAGMLIAFRLILMLLLLGWLAWYVMILFRCRAVMASQPARVS